MRELPRMPRPCTHVLDKQLNLSGRGAVRQESQLLAVFRPDRIMFRARLFRWIRANAYGLVGPLCFRHVYLLCAALGSINAPRDVQTIRTQSSLRERLDLSLLPVKGRDLIPQRLGIGRVLRLLRIRDACRKAKEDHISGRTDDLIGSVLQSTFPSCSLRNQV